MAGYSRFPGTYFWPSRSSFRRFVLASRWGRASAARSLWSSRIPISPFPWMAHRLSRSLLLLMEDCGSLRSDRGHLYFSSIFRELAVHMPVRGQQQSVFGWGLNLSSTWRVVGRDTVELAGGLRQWNLQPIRATGSVWAWMRNPRVGCGPDAESTANSSLRGSVISTAGTGPSDRMRRLDCCRFQNTAFQPGTTYHKSTYSSANVIWNAIWQPVFRRGVYVWMG